MAKIKWTPTQLSINKFLDAGKTKPDIMQELGCGASTVEKVITARNQGYKPPISKESKGEEAPSSKGTKESKAPPETSTTEITEASILKLVPKVQSLPLTPDIFIGYMCAIARGFPGEIADWLSITSRDFWYGRGINPYEYVSKIGSGEIKEVTQIADKQTEGVAK